MARRIYCQYPDGRCWEVGVEQSGWCFKLYTYPNDGIYCLEDWELRFSVRGTFLIDQRGVSIPADVLLGRIRNSVSGVDWTVLRQFHFKGRLLDKFLNDNLAELGPNGLLRHKIGWGCTAHGEGTWDVCERETPAGEELKRISNLFRREKVVERLYALGDVLPFSGHSQLAGSAVSILRYRPDTLVLVVTQGPKFGMILLILEGIEWHDAEDGAPYITQDELRRALRLRTGWQLTDDGSSLESVAGNLRLQDE